MKSNSTTLISALFLILVTPFICQAAPLEGWVSLFDPQANDPRFIGESAATASPVTAEADQDCIATNFAPVTLTDGDSITVSGTVTFDVPLAGTQFRVGLFNGAAVAQDVGNPYLGVYSEAPTTTPSNLKYGDGTNPSHAFGTGTVISDAILPGGGGVDAETPINFSLTITRSGANLDITTSYTDGGDYNRSGSVEDLDILSTAPGFDYTFNTAGFLMGGSMNGGRATFENIELSGAAVAKEPFNITRVERSPAGDMVTLEWDSREGESYAVKVSSDLGDWEADLDDSIQPDAGDTTSRTFDISRFAGRERLCFRIER